MFVEKSSRRVTIIQLVTLLSLISLTTGCAGQLRNWWHNGFKVGPDYMKPAAQVAEEYAEVADPQITDAPPDYEEWWTVFNDPYLNRLIAIASQQGNHDRSAYQGTAGPNQLLNVSLREAALRVLKAREALGIARGNLAPQQQDAFFDYQKRQGSRQTFPTNQSAGIFLPKRSHSFWDLGMSATWELDVWGRFRRAVEAGQADLDFAIEDYDALMVSILGDVAQTYYQIRTLQQGLFYTLQNVEAQRGALELAETKFNAGATTELDVQQARTNLESTRALVPEIRKRIQQQKNLLCYLIGTPPHDIDGLLGNAQASDENSLIPAVPTQVAVGIPADLMRRRPDLRAAERRVAAESARIGVAASDLFPTVSILGSVQYEAEFLGDLVAGNSVAGVFGGPAIRWPILNYYRIRNNINLQDTVFQEVAAEYERKVLQANREVADTLVGFIESQKRAAFLAASVAASKRSVEIAVTQYRGGIVDFNRVFTLQTILATQQNDFALAQGSAIQELIATYRNLGGGWQIRLNPPPKVEYAESIEPPAPENGQPMLPNGPAAGNNGALQAPLPMPGNAAALQPTPIPEPPAAGINGGPAATMIRFMPPQPAANQSAHAWKFPARPEVVPVGHWERQPPLRQH